MSKIKSIIRKQIENQKLYNLAVLEDESYIANDIVVHNCRSVLIPITKYEEFTPSETVGKSNIQDFIEENKGDGFSTYSKKEIKITDDGVSFVTDCPDPLTEVITYSKNNKAFKEVTIKYSDEKRLKPISLANKEIK